MPLTGLPDTVDAPDTVVMIMFPPLHGFAVTDVSACIMPPSPGPVHSRRFGYGADFAGESDEMTALCLNM
ncbi:hypothetical protein BBNG_01131 [Bifidobacterium bifidum NCIMB 41171]|nr:hypothetical protein BBNG_01131 [Bifidobacterium bifidum NCIMB 41171]